MLATEPAAIGLVPTAELPSAWGVVIDWGTSAGSVTFVAVADGTSSMYSSAGGGTLGAGGHAGIDAARNRLLHVADAAYDQLAPADAAADPRPDWVAYWVLGFDGLRTGGHGAIGGPPRDQPHLVALGNAFQAYVREFRHIDEERAAATRRGR